MVNFKLGFGKELIEEIKNYSPSATADTQSRTEKSFFRVREKNILPQIITNLNKE